MKSKKIKGDIGAVKADIRPYLKKGFLHKAYLDASDGYSCMPFHSEQIQQC